MFAFGVTLEHVHGGRAIFSTVRLFLIKVRLTSPRMSSSRAKIAIGCTIALAIPILLIAAMIAGLFLKSFNDARVERHLTISQAIGEWRSSSAAEEAGLTPAQRERRDMNASAKMMACPFAIFMIAGYFVPTVIAFWRKHPQVVAIAVLNVFLGWTFLGWLGSLVWALVVTNDGNRAPAPEVGNRDVQATTRQLQRR